MACEIDEAPIQLHFDSFGCRKQFGRSWPRRYGAELSLSIVSEQQSCDCPTNILVITNRQFKEGVGCGWSRVPDKSAYQRYSLKQICYALECRGDAYSCL